MLSDLREHRDWRNCESVNEIVSRKRAHSRVAFPFMSLVRARVLGAMLSWGLVACHGRAGEAPRAQPVYDHSCQADADCFMVSSCCPSPCGTELVNARDIARANNDLQCDSSEQCPVAGGCIEHQSLCVEHVCKIVFVGDAAYRKREPAP